MTDKYAEFLTESLKVKALHRDDNSKPDSLDEGDVVQLRPDDPAKPTKHPKTVDHGFDLTAFNPYTEDPKEAAKAEKQGVAKWKKVLSAAGIPPKAELRPLAPGSAARGWFWEGDGVEIVTGNNPLTGEYSQPGGRQKEKGYASYIGITGPAPIVKKIVSVIKKEADFIKDESRGRRDYI